MKSLNTNNAKGICNTDCKLYRTPHCSLLNMDSCQKCYVSKLSAKDQLLVMDDICTIAAAMPYGGMEDISSSDECLLCKGHKHREASCYARFSIGHLHPTASNEHKTNKTDYKRDAAIVVPVQIPACSKCKSNVNKINYIPLLVGLLVSALGIYIVSLAPVRNILEQSGRIIPFLVTLIAIFLGVIVGSVTKSLLATGAESKTHIRPNHIKTISELLNDGWFTITNSEMDIPYTFSPKKLKRGLLTGKDQEEIINDILNWDQKSAL